MAKERELKKQLMEEFERLLNLEKFRARFPGEYWANVAASRGICTDLKEEEIKKLYKPMRELLRNAVSGV